MRNECTQDASLDAVVHRPSYPFLDQGTPYIEQSTVTYPRGTRGFTGSASEAAVKMALRVSAGLRSLKNLLDQVDAAARTVEFIPKQLVSGAGCRAEAAVHAGTQYGFGFLAVCGAAEAV